MSARKTVFAELDRIVRYIEKHEPGLGALEPFDPRFCKTPRIVAGLQDCEEIYMLSLSNAALGAHVDAWKAVHKLAEATQ